MLDPSRSFNARVASIKRADRLAILPFIALPSSAWTLNAVARGDGVGECARQDISEPECSKFR